MRTGRTCVRLRVRDAEVGPTANAELKEPPAVPVALGLRRINSRFHQTGREKGERDRHVDLADAAPIFAPNALQEQAACSCSVRAD